MSGSAQQLGKRTGAYETSEIEAAGVLVGTLVGPCHDVFVEKGSDDIE
jgi:hypothetical protein